MKVIEKDLYRNGSLDLACFPVKRKTEWDERKCLFVKPINCYVPLTTLVNTYLKTLKESK